MAEGGGEEDSINPFSFKSYVKKKTKQFDEEELDSDDIFSVTSIPSRKKDKKTLVVGDDEFSKSKKDKENPFSFKKFLGQSDKKTSDWMQQPPTQPALHEGGSHLGQSVSMPCFSQRSVLPHRAGVPPDFASDLPDFIQDRFEEPRLDLDSESKDCLPDFHTTSSHLHPQIDGNDLLLVGKACADGHISKTLSDDGESDSGSAVLGHPLHLPDFLVDSAVPGLQGGNKTCITSDGKTSVAHLRSEIPELPVVFHGSAEQLCSEMGNASGSITIDLLQEENQQLKAIISQMQQKTDAEKTRVAGLEKELKRLRKKEAEETEVMEKAVQQVEQNLVATTTRAVKAETLVTKLKQEIKVLQVQIRALTLENETLKSEDRGLADIRERTKYASEQLAAAAVTADRSLKDLVEGVEKLKLLSLVLSSLEKITEQDSQTANDNSASSPS